jgi:amino acid adenylation domain-containing protein
MIKQQSSLLAAIAANIENCHDKAALWVRGRSYSYGELQEVSAGIRDLLCERQIPEGSRIGVVTGDDLHTYASLLAILSLNCAYVPININNPPQRNERIISTAGLAAILSSHSVDENSLCLPGTAAEIGIVATTNAEKSEEPLSFPKVSSDDLAYIFFTSGSTGTPKGVPISHGNLNAFMDTFIHRMGYDFASHDRFLQMFEMTFDLSVVSIFAPWYCGACCCVVPDEGIAYLNIIKVLAEQEVTVAVMVPSLLGYLQRFFDEISLPSLRLNFFCGEALTHEMTKQWSSCIPNARIENVYGPTEATIWCTWYSWTEQQSAAESVNDIVPIGRPVPGSETIVIDAKDSPCRPGEKGELVLIGPQVMSGYWQNPEKTAEAFVDLVIDGEQLRAYRSGDIAFVNELDNLIYCGRMDSQVKIDGHRVELGEIEHSARRLIGSSKAAVVLRKDSSGQPVIFLFVAGNNIDASELDSQLRSELPVYMRPREIVILDDLPVNLNGKIDRLALASMIEN